MARQLQMRNVDVVSRSISLQVNGHRYEAVRGRPFTVESEEDAQELLGFSMRFAGARTERLFEEVVPSGEEPSTITVGQLEKMIGVMADITKRAGVPIDEDAIRISVGLPPTKEAEVEFEEEPEEEAEEPASLALTADALPGSAVASGIAPVRKPRGRPLAER